MEPSAASVDARPARRPRNHALDALRGLAILGMALSGMVPWGTLPAWMYHAQVGPPKMVFDNTVRGITWVDLVFPFFLFAMGAAIPLSLGKMAENLTWRTAGPTILRLFVRFFSLAAFAFASQQLRFSELGAPPGPPEQWMAIGLFFAMLLAWGRWPERWPVWFSVALNGVGAALIGAALVWVNQKRGGFDPTGKVDIILLVLANVALSGGVLWLLTRHSSRARLGFMALVGAMFLVQDTPGLGQTLWTGSPLPWLISWEFHKYLIPVLIGTLAGDALARADRWRVGGWQGSLIGWLLFALSPLACVTLLARDQALGLGLAGVALFAAWMLIPKGDAGRDLRRSVETAGFLVILGYVLESHAGGIRKDDATISYLILTPALGWCMLLGLVQSARLAGALRPTPEGEPESPYRLGIWGLLVGTGVNPLLGYAAITNLVPGAVRVTGFEPWVASWGMSPWGMAGYGLFKTLLVAMACVLATRFRISMRA